MRFQYLGKTHRVRVFGLEIRVIYLVSLIGGFLVGTLLALWVQAASFALTIAASLGLAFLLAKVSEAPFCKEILTHPLKRRVSWDP